MGGYSDSEYSRRNLQVCRAIGAQAAVDQALDRAKSLKRFPKWAIAYLESAANRLPGLSIDLAAFRDAAPDCDQWGPRAAAKRVEEHNARTAALQATPEKSS